MGSAGAVGGTARTVDRPDWAVIVVNYGSHLLIDANLGWSLDGTRVVVVDNYHSDVEREDIAKVAARRGWDLVPLPGNRGFGAAVNAGAARARALGCRGFLLLNPDARVSAEVVATLRQHVLREPRSLVSPRIADASGHTVFQGVELMLDRGSMRRAGIPHSGHEAGRPAELWLTGACLAVHDELFTRIGGFDEKYFLYWEDVDLCHRAVDAGGKLFVRDDLLAIHDEGGTQGMSGARAKSALYYYFNCRNRLLFAARNLDRAGLLRWLLHTPSASWEILMRGGRRQLLHSPGPALAALRGTFAGVRVAIRALLRKNV